MFHSIRQFVENHSREYSKNRVDSAKALILDSSYGFIDGCVCIFFEHNSGKPLWIAKGAHSTTRKAILEQEFENLQELSKRGINNNSPIRAPKPLAIRRDGGAVITLQTAVPGTALKNLPGKKLFSRKHINSTLSAFFDWWHAFHKATGICRKSLSSKIYEKDILIPLHHFQQRFLLTDNETEFLNHRYKQEKILLNIELPYMVRHGDLCADNIALHDNDIAVFDWEYPLDYHLPLFDLFTFFSSVRFPYKGLSGVSTHFESFKSVFWGHNYFNDNVVRCILDQCQRFEIPVKTIPDLFLFFLIQMANLKYEYLLQGHNIKEESIADEPYPDSIKKKRWQSFQHSDKNGAFACISGGAFKNVSYLLDHGFPEFE